VQQIDARENFAAKLDAERAKRQDATPRAAGG
jgi:hypothetical protein